MTQLRRLIPSELGALLDSGAPLQVCDLVTITLPGGVVLNWTSSDAAVTLDGITWTLGPGLSAGRQKWAAGVEVGTLTLRLFADASVQINGTPLLPFISNGGFDGAAVDVWRAFAPAIAPGALGAGWAGRLHRFSGSVSDIDRPSRVEAEITLRDEFEVLNRPLPRGLYEHQCDRVVYSSGCGANRNLLKVSASVTTASDAQRMSFYSDGLLSRPVGYFALGTVAWTSGILSGVVRAVRGSKDGVITLVNPMPAQPSPGDTFEIVPGCPRDLTTCSERFGRRGRFRGTPFVPAADTIL